MTVTLKTQKMLWGRAAGRCSMPECRMELVQSSIGVDDQTVIGENCHIVAESDEGPRADPTIPLERRNTYDNLILLCSNHHKLIDSQENECTVAKLREMKSAHEVWVREKLGFDNNKQEDEEIYTGIIDVWTQLAHINEWNYWTGFLLGEAPPRMDTQIDKDLTELRIWLLKQIYPDRYPELNKSFYNFHNVLQDFHNVFRKESEQWGKDELRTKSVSVKNQITS
jgi:hypothetical protein